MNTTHRPINSPLTHSPTQDPLDHDLTKRKEEEVGVADALPSPAAEEEPLTLEKKMVEKPHALTIPPKSPSTKMSSPASSTSATISDFTTEMTKEQLRMATAIIRNLKKHRDASPFVLQVDASKAPDYYTIIDQPMDLLTVEQKLNDTAYVHVDHFVADVRLIFANCYRYNGMDSTLSLLAQNVESAFDKGMRQMPACKDMSPSLTNSPGSMVDGKARKHSSPYIMQLPKRESHPPPSKDYPATITKQPQYTTATMKYCIQTLRELKKQRYNSINFPFLEPVDPIKLGIPDYPTIVKHPMDLATIENKLNNSVYTNPGEFAQDIRLMFNNCYLYNAPNLPVHQMGRQLEKVFDDKWAQRPSETLTPPPSATSTGHPMSLAKKSRRRSRASTSSTSGKKRRRSQPELSDDDSDADERITALERHLASLSKEVATFKKNPRAAPKPKAKRQRTTPTKRRNFTFEEKKALSEKINNLSGNRLLQVVDIIKSSMPNLTDEDGEIVLDIDALDQNTLWKLYDLVHDNGVARTSTSDRLSSLENQLKYLSRSDKAASSSDNDSASESDDMDSSDSD
ncbi:Bromodomain-containing protein [Gongronella butleri]|nr:Bromodomain-containing protein [Gongronella butleri]